MPTDLEKDRTIIRLLDQLWSRLGPDAFVIVDHWEADRRAIGIASPRNHGVLAYLSTYDQAPERFYVELELPPRTDDDFPYQIAGTYENVDIEHLIDLVSKHLANAEPADPTGA